MPNMTITVDYENNCEIWWDAAHASQDAPEAVRPLLRNTCDSVTVTAEECAAVQAWASSLPGWDDPEAASFAPYPLIFSLAS